MGIVEDYRAIRYVKSVAGHLGWSVEMKKGKMSGSFVLTVRRPGGVLTAVSDDPGRCWRKMAEVCAGLHTFQE